MFGFFFQKRSAFSPLFNTIADDIVEISLLLKELSGNFTDIESVRRRAEDIERKADETTYAAINLLNESFITPFDREDIHHLVHHLDDVIDVIEDLIRNISLYRPAAEPAALSKFADLIVESSYALKTLVEKYLDPPRYSPEVTALKKRLFTLEDRADEEFAAAIRSLFANEKDPLELVKQKDILEGLEDVMDTYLSVGKAIENIVVKTR